MKTPDAGSDITGQLIAWSDGRAEALDELVPRVEAELRRLARIQLSRERPGHTLQTLDLVSEAYLRLVDQKRTTWQNRAHFYAIASRIMRRVLLDRARKRHATRRGGGAVPVELDKVLDKAGAEEVDPLETQALHDALARLEELSPRQGRVVELRVFGGLTIRETAEVMTISPATVKREWELARAWLHREITRT